MVKFVKFVNSWLLSTSKASFTCHFCHFSPNPKRVFRAYFFVGLVNTCLEAIGTVDLIFKTHKSPLQFMRSGNNNTSSQSSFFNQFYFRTPIELVQYFLRTFYTYRTFNHLRFAKSDRA